MKMSHRRSVLIALGLALSVGCDRSGTGPEAAVSYFPLAVGNTWTYAPQDPFYGDPFEWNVNQRRGEVVDLTRPAGTSHAGAVTLLDRSSQIDLFLGDDGFAPFYRFTPGTSWIHHDPWECDDGAGFTAVEEPDDVVTPAGTFRNTLRIERTTTVSCTDAGTTFEWWAPGVGLVKWEELNFYAGGPITFELISYTVN